MTAGAVVMTAAGAAVMTAVVIVVLAPAMERMKDLKHRKKELKGKCFFLYTLVIVL